jgi:hypothetical protein
MNRQQKMGGMRGTFRFLFGSLMEKVYSKKQGMNVRPETE